MPGQKQTFEEYLAALPEERREPMTSLRTVILENIPEGFSESISKGSNGLSGMIHYVIPHSRYPDGYHCNPKLPLMLIGIASQKNYISLHHLGIYGSTTLLEWFQTEWAKASTRKLDMGKGCIRFKKPDEIPFQLIGKLAGKITADKWIEFYEKAIKRS